MLSGPGWRLRQTLVWVKDAFVLGRSDYHYRHEPILYGHKPTEGRIGRGARGFGVAVLPVDAVVTGVAQRAPVLETGAFFNSRSVSQWHLSTVAIRTLTRR